MAILEGAVGNFFSWGVMNRWERTVSFVITAPELISAAATDLAGIGSTISAANAAASASTTAVAAAAADEVSTAVATLFGAHAQQYQSLGSQMAAFHDDFVRILDPHQQAQFPDGLAGALSSGYGSRPAVATLAQWRWWNPSASDVASLSEASA